MLPITLPLVTASAGSGKRPGGCARGGEAWWWWRSGAGGKQTELSGVRAPGGGAGYGRVLWVWSGAMRCGVGRMALANEGRCLGT